MHGVSLGAGNWPLDVKTGAVLANVATAVETFVALPVVVVTAASAAAIGWGTHKAGAGLGKAGQLGTIKLQLVVTAAVVVGWGGGEAVVTIIVVVDDVLDIADVVETELDSLIFLRRFLASSRLSGEAGLGINSVNLKQPKGLIMYPSSLFSIFKFNSK